MDAILKALKLASREICSNIASLHIEHEKLRETHGQTNGTKEMLDKSREIIFLGNIADDIDELIESIEIFQTKNNCHKCKNNA